MMKQAPPSAKKNDQKIQGLLRKSTFEPPELNELVDEVFYITQGGPFNVRALADRLKEDVALTGRILRICRLPYYSGTTTIRSMAQAIQRLGPSGFRSVVMQAFLDMSVYSSEQWGRELEQLKVYSLIVAHISRIISRYSTVQADTVFLCALLHRIGFSVGLNKLTSKEDGLDEVWHALEMSHTIFGRMVLVEWGIQEDVQNVVANYGQLVINGEVNHLSATILVAEEIARRFKFNIYQSKFARKEQLGKKMNDNTTHAIEVLELDEEMLQNIYRDSHFVLSQGLRLHIS